MSCELVPVRLVLVVGPSGAGKDTLMARAAVALAGEARITFPRRVVTRVADAAEDHDSLDAAEFAAAVAKGCFALHWQAHGLAYGIPAAALCGGGVAVCNVSRAVIAQARAQFSGTQMVYVTAPREIRAARLAARGREAGQADAILARLAREVTGDAQGSAELVIDNNGSVEAGAARLAGFLVSLVDG